MSNKEVDINSPVCHCSKQQTNSANLKISLNIKKRNINLHTVVIKWELLSFWLNSRTEWKSGTLSKLSRSAFPLNEPLANPESSKTFSGYLRRSSILLKSTLQLTGLGRGMHIQKVNKLESASTMVVKARCWFTISECEAISAAGVA